MFVRKPAVADMFYPADPAELKRYLDAVMQPSDKKISPKSIIVPHAGYVYSGDVAAKVYSLIEPFDIYLIMGPNHTGLGAEISIFDGMYEMPFGTVKSNSRLIALLSENEYAEIDYYAHLQEHSIEVQLPFIDYITPHEYEVATVVVGTHNVAKLYSFAETVAKAISSMDKRVLMVVSSDMNHYEDQQTTIEKDRKAIAAIEKLDENELLRMCSSYSITMCGAAPAYVAIAASKMLGAEKVTVVAHKTSGDVNGDYSKVVGYAGIIIE